MNYMTNINKCLFKAFFVLATVSLVACADSSNNRNSSSSDEPLVLAALSVTSTAPADTEAGVERNGKVVAVFNKEVKSETVTESSFTLQGESEAAITGAVTYDADTTTASFTPGSDLTASTLYTATITTDVQDLAGDSLLENFAWTFTTGEQLDKTAPQVDTTATTPGDTDSGVLRNVKLNIVFNEAIDPVTVTEQSIVLTDDDAVEVVSGTLSFINPTTVVFSPDADLAGTTNHTLALSDEITDLAGNSLAVLDRKSVV